MAEGGGIAVGEAWEADQGACDMLQYCQQAALALLWDLVEKETQSQVISYSAATIACEEVGSGRGFWHCRGGILTGRSRCM